MLTDLRLFGFPVVFDTELAKNIIDLRNPDGQRLRIVIGEPLAVDAEIQSDGSGKGTNGA